MQYDINKIQLALREVVKPKVELVPLAIKSK